MMYRPALIGLLFFFFFSLPVVASELSIGDKAPSLSGQNATQKGLIRLSRLMKQLGYLKDKNGDFIERNGKYVMHIQKNVVILNFFATYCIPCIREIPAYNRLYQKYKNEAVKLLYVNVDPDLSPASIQDFISQKKIQVPMMLPNQRKTMKDFSITGLPKIVVIAQDGTVADIITGFEEDLEAQLDGIIKHLQ